MGHYDDGPSDKEVEMEKIRRMAQEYRYITDNYEVLNTKLADLNIHDLLDILDKLKGAKEVARWSRM